MRDQTCHCDIFCRVVDNFGDAGVCWRLARQLVAEHRWRVRLWIDDLATLARLAPDPAMAGVEVAHWTTDFPATTCADVVIEAFACELPETYIAGMATQATAPVWLNLEYLSAEAWTLDCHGMASRHPRLPLTKYFFFPGFDARSGGLLRERDYATRQAAFNAPAWRAEFGVAPKQPDELTISMFSYPNPALPMLLDAWTASSTPITLLCPGRGGERELHGALTIQPLPFVPQARYDELLWAADLNFVRGEDSFVRAQWAGKPFVWHIYPQHDDAHRTKLEAFLERHPGGALLAPFWRAWNGEGVPDWPAFVAQWSPLVATASAWRQELSQLPDLAEKLVDFSRQQR